MRDRILRSLKAIEADAAPLSPETLAKFARVEGIAGSEDVYLPEQFRAQMTTEGFARATPVTAEQIARACVGAHKTTRVS